MIRIHRRKWVVYVNGKQVKLSQEEHYLLTALGIMDNRLVPYDVILDVMCEGQAQIPDNKLVIQEKVYRLRKKVGIDVLQNKRDLGYVLSGDVQFVG